MARGASAVLLIQVGGAGLSYLSHIVLARVLDAAGYGVYSYVMAWTSLLAIPAGLGLSTALVRFVSQYRQKGADGLLRGVAIRGWQLVVVAGTLIAGLASGFIVWGAERFGIQYAEALLVGIWIVPLRAVISVQVAMSRGLKRMTLAYLPGKIVRPLLLLSGVGLLLRIQGTIDDRMALGVAVASFFIAIVGQGTVLGRRVVSITDGACKRFKTKRWLRISLPMLLISGFLLIMSRTDVVMLGMLVGAEDVGTYNAASRTANVASFVLIAVNAIAAPTIASLYSEGRHEKLQELASTVAHFIFWPSLVVVVGLIAAAPFILRLFGSEFVAADTVLTVLAVGHLVNVGVGSVGYLMNMTGNQDEMARVVGTAAIINIVLNAVAIPIYGALGAALATAVSMAVWNVWLNRVVVARLSIRPSIVHAVRQFVPKGS